MKKSISTLPRPLRSTTLALLLPLLSGLIMHSGIVPAATPDETAVNQTVIRMHVDGVPVSATLIDNSAARDFASLLPLSLTLDDYAVVERISPLPRSLSTADAAAGITPRTGDITYYAPWGNLAIFVGDNRYARGLVPLGKVTEGLEALQRSGPLNIRIELEEN